MGLIPDPLRHARLSKLNTWTLFFSLPATLAIELDFIIPGVHLCPLLDIQNQTFLYNPVMYQYIVKRCAPIKSFNTHIQMIPIC